MSDSQREMSASTLRKVRQLKIDFVDSFAARAHKLQAWRGDAVVAKPVRDSVTAMRTEIHQLRGSAGLYQMDELYGHLNALQDLLDAALEAEPLQPLNEASLKHLDRIIKLLKYPNRFL